ncbi:unnamed protein product [Chrysoparadoxa australica]
MAEIDAIARLNALEEACLVGEGLGEVATGTVLESVAPPAAAKEAAHMLATGRYWELVRSCRLFAFPFEPKQDLAEQVRRGVEEWVMEEEDEMQGRWRAAEAMWVGAALLNLYLQANYTGPELEVEVSSACAEFVGRIARSQQEGEAVESTGSSGAGAVATSKLAVDGELCFPRSELPGCLLLARLLLSALAEPAGTSWVIPVQSKDDELAHQASSELMINKPFCARCESLSTAAWWSARAVGTHSRLLLLRPGDRSETLWMEARRLWERVVIRHCKAKGYLAATAWVEWGLCLHFFQDNMMGKGSFKHAVEASGLQVELTGAMGKRTKYQEEKAQLVVLASSAQHREQRENKASEEKAPDMAQAAEQAGTLRVIQHKEESHLLEETTFSSEELQSLPPLHRVDLVILLALCLDVANSNPHDGLTNEQMTPYLARVLSEPSSNWMIYSTALLQRAWLEFERPHRMDRSVLQLQALLDQHTSRLTVTQSSMASVEEAASPEERLAYIHALAYPPRWELQRDLAVRYRAMGLLNSAAEMFITLEMWDELVACYLQLSLQTKAETLIRERLSVAETPQMLTAMGNLSNDRQYFDKAWLLSKKRYVYAYAQEGLGRLLFSQGDLEGAKEAFQAVVHVKPLMPSVWFTLGAICMRQEDWETALQAFTRVVQQSPEEGDAWGNCGAIHMHNRNWGAAHAALTEGLKQKQDSWRMWENQVTVLLSLNRWEEAIYATNRLLDLQEKLMTLRREGQRSSWSCY